MPKIHKNGKIILIHINYLTFFQNFKQPLQTHTKEKTLLFI